MVTWPVCPGEEPIAAYAAGRLPRLERDAIDAHLDTCRACSEVVAELAKLASSRDASEPVPSGWNPASTIGGAGEVDDRLFDGQLGRYVLLARIGAGGLGIVYSAYDPELDRRVALKILRTRADAIRGEARAIAKLAHPNVVAVHDVGRVDDAAFVAMEYVDGVTLREWLATSRTPAQILDVFIQAGRGIAAAHAAGLVHRDIKPSNIMIGSDGRARVLDFGLASAADDPVIGGTPAYMAPEQARGETVDARADQYAFCVALWEGLTGERPNAEGTKLPHVAEPVVRALRRGLSPDPAARFPSFDALLAGLVPPPSRRHLPWLIGAIVALCAAVGVMLVIPEDAPSCGEPVAKIWGANQREAVRSAFAATKLPFANATTLIAQLDDWSARWKLGAEATCRQPAQVLRQSCLDDLLDQLRPIVALATHADANVVERADVLVPSLPAPERCERVVGDIAPPGEHVRAEVEAVRPKLDELEAQLIAGRDIDIAPIRARADATGYAPLRARAMFLVARLDNVRTRFTLAITELHTAAQLATAARDQELLAEIWIELVKSLGNDPRVADEADLFEGYVAALIPELPNHAQLAQQLAHARCTRNVTGAAVAAAATSCVAAIQLAERAGLYASANAERVRLGHFQRMLGKTAESLATLEAAVAEAERVFGAAHPDTAIAHYALGIAEISSDQLDAGLAELRTALAIRRAAFPEGGPAVAESLQGLGDALGTAGRHAEAVPVLEEGLAMLDRAHQGESAEAANMQLLAGMSLEELHRTDEAIAHDLRGADIADRSLEHREELAAMGLRMAANLEPPAAGLAHAERALRLLERGHGSLAALGKTQLLIAEKTGERARARAMAITARANLVAAGAAGAEDLPEAEAFLKTH